MVVSPHHTCLLIFLPSPFPNPTHFPHPVHNPSFPFTVIGLQPAGERVLCGVNSNGKPTSPCILICDLSYRFVAILNCKLASVSLVECRL
jgi:hypothetical protein